MADPRNPGQTLAEAVRFLQTGKPSRADSLLRSFLKTFPKHPQALYLLGMAKLGNKRPAEAVKYLEQACTANPPSSEPYLNLGVVLEQLGKKDKAVEAYRRAGAKDPNNPMVWSALGTAQLSLKRFAEAEENLRRSVRLAPRHPMLKYNLGLALRTRDRQEEAAECFAQAAELDPKNPVHSYHEGMARASAGNWARAAEAFERATGLNGKDPNPVANLSRLAMIEGNLEKAEELLDRAEALASSAGTKAMVSGTRAILSLAKGEEEETVTHLKAAAATDREFQYWPSLHLGPALDEAVERGRRVIAEDLPPLKGDPAPTGDGVLIFSACDSGYLNRFGPDFVTTLAQSNPGRSLHLHVYNPTSKDHDLIDGFRSVEGLGGLSFSYEQGAPASKEYYADARFIRIRDLLEQAQRPIFACDMDTVFKKPLENLDALAEEHDITLRRRPSSLRLHLLVAVGGMVVKPSKGAFRFFDLYAPLIASALTEGTPAWFLDQVIFSIVEFRLALAGEEVSLAALPRIYSDWGHNEDASVWTFKGQPAG